MESAARRAFGHFRELLAVLVACLVAVTIHAMQPAEAATPYLATFVWGQQLDFTKGAVNDPAPSATTMNGVNGVAIDTVPHIAWMADFANHRVLGHQLDTSNRMIDDKADYVLGQANFTTVTSGLSSTKMNGPTAVAMNNASSPRRLYVSDFNNNRVLVFNVTTTPANGAAANFVFGQANFTTGTAGAVSATSMSSPEGVAVDATNNRLYVADNGYNRVLIYNTASPSNGMAAINVVGQTNLTSSGALTTSTTLRSPTGVAYDAVNSKLWVADYMNNRVVSFNMSTLSNGKTATNVLGQSGFTTSGFATTATTMDGPKGVAATSTRLYVSDNWNNRITIFDVSAVTNGEAATGVLGQPNLTTNSGPAPGQGTLYAPYHPTYDAVSGHLFVADAGNNRVLAYDTTSAALSATPNTEVGALYDVDITGNPNATASITGGSLPPGLSMTSDGRIAGTATTAGSYNFTVTVANTAGDPFTYSAGLGRAIVVAARTLPAAPNPAYQISEVLGHEGSFVDGLANDGLGAATAKTLSGTSAVVVDATADVLWVADSSNHRVLGYQLTTGHRLIDDTADFVLGQANFTSNSSGTSSTTMWNPTSLAIDVTGRRLFVGEMGNSRVLMFSITAPTNGMAATRVIGQANFTAKVIGSGSTMFLPSALAYDSATNRLWVSDGSANRLLVFSVATVTNGMAASNVIGQPDFTAFGPILTAYGTKQAESLVVDSANNRLYVADNRNNRVLVYDTATVTDYEAAIGVIGQGGFTTAVMGTTRNSFFLPTGIALDGAGRLYVSTEQGRVLVFDTVSLVNGRAADFVLGHTDFTSDTFGVGVTRTTVGGEGMWFDTTSGSLFVADSLNHRVAVIDTGAALGTGALTATEVGALHGASVPGNINGVYSVTAGSLPPGLTLSAGGVFSGTATTAGTYNFTVTVTHSYFGYSVANPFSLVVNARTLPAAPSTAYAPTAVLGHNGDMSVKSVLDGAGSATAGNMYTPTSTVVDNTAHVLWVSDYNNHRVLGFQLDSLNRPLDDRADIVLGQTDMTTRTSQPAAAGLSFPIGLAVHESARRLYVADSGNNRVVVYNITSPSNGMASLYVLGQTVNTGTAFGIGASNMDSPSGVALDTTAGRLYVADRNNNRVLVFNTASITANGVPAVNVLGQRRFSKVAAGSGTGSVMSSPFELAVDAGANRLYVADSFNDRVLVFDTTTITDGMSALLVVGQSDFSTKVTVPSRNIMRGPSGLAVDVVDKRLYVVSSTDHRILVFNTTSLVSGAAAEFVLGQTNFTTASTGSTFNAPESAEFDTTSGALFVADTVNNRVLSFDTKAGLGLTMPATEENADYSATIPGNPNGVTTLDSGSLPPGLSLGAAGLVSGRATTAGTYNFSIRVQATGVYTYNTVGPFSITVAAKFLNAPPAAAYRASTVLGHADFSSYSANDGLGAPTASTLNSADAMAIDSVRHVAWVADTSNARVLGYQLGTDNLFLDRVADYVIGQVNFTSSVNTFGSASVMSLVRGVAIDPTAGRLYVSDSGNHRVLGFDITAPTNGMAAVAVLGQTGMTGAAASSTASRMDAPRGLAVDNVNRLLYVADSGNSRVSVFNLTGLSNGATPIYTLGQPSQSSKQMNRTSSAYFDFPYDVTVDSSSNRLYVADWFNNRVVVFDTTSLATGMEPIAVIGQANFKSRTAAAGRTGLTGPGGVAVDPSRNRLFVSGGSQRVLVFDTATLVNGEAAQQVLGSVDFTTPDPGNDTGFVTPSRVHYDALSDRLYVGDPSAHRITGFEMGVTFTTSGPLAIGNIGTTYSNSVAGGGSNPNGVDTFAVTGGALPPGLSLAPDGEITGVPTSGGDYSFTVTLTKDLGPWGTAQDSSSFSIYIEYPSLSVGTVGGSDECNATAPTGTSTALALNFGKLRHTQNAVLTQRLWVMTNAASGYTTSVRLLAPMSTPGGAVLNGSAFATPAAPGDFPAPGTTAIGYTTSGYVAGATIDRFSNPVKWAPLTTSFSPISWNSGQTPYDDVCFAIQVGVAGNTNPGQYNGTVVYSTVPNF